MNVETVFSAAIRLSSPFASIEPRSYERGNVSRIADRQRLAMASIEPRSYERGNWKLEAMMRNPCHCFN